MFFFISSSFAKFLIQYSNTDTFISGDFSTETPINLDNFEHAVRFKFLTDDNTGARVYVATGKNTNVAWRYDVLMDRLVFSPLIKDRERTFKFIPLEIFERKYWIASGEFCIGWNKKETMFKRVKCNREDPAQQFYVHEIGDQLTGLNYELMMEKKRKEQESVDLSHRNEKDGEILIGSIHGLIKNLIYCFDKTGVCKPTDNFLDSFYAQSLVVAGGFANVKSSSSRGSNGGFAVGSNGESNIGDFSDSPGCNCSPFTYPFGSAASSLRATGSSSSRSSSSGSSSSGSSSSGSSSSGLSSSGSSLFGLASSR